MDLTQFKAEYPDIYKVILAEGTEIGKKEGVLTGFDEGKKEGMVKGTEEGKKIELERIKAINDLAFAGHEKLVEEMISDGTSASDAAKKILINEKAIRIATIATLDADGIPPIPPATPPANPETKKNFETLVAEAMVEGKLSKGQAVKKISMENPEAHEAYLRKINNK